MLEIGDGYRAKNSEMGTSGLPFARAGNVNNGFHFDDVDILSKESVRIAGDKLSRPGDITFTSKGTFGRFAFVRRDTPPFVYSPQLCYWRVKRDGVVERRFLYYWMQGADCMNQLNEIKGLTDMADYVNLTNQRKMWLSAPPIPAQRKIADILSAYDELIENNQRRIKILEAMARSLYREWFVHFRFPGHDKAKMVPSLLGPIPQDWEVKEMQEVADVIDCLHSKKPEACPDGLGVLLQLNNIGDGGKLDMRELFRISANDYELWTSRIELQPGDCVVTNVGRVGAVAQIPDGVKAAPGRNMTAIRPRSGQLTPTFLIECLLSSHMASEVAKKKDLGTIMDSLNVKGIIRLHIPCPPMDAMLKFESIGRPMRKRIEVLVEQIQNLRRTRDLLLPRLLSGNLSLN